MRTAQHNATKQNSSTKKERDKERKRERVKGRKKEEKRGEEEEERKKEQQKTEAAGIHQNNTQGHQPKEHTRGFHVVLQM